MHQYSKTSEYFSSALGDVVGGVAIVVVAFLLFEYGPGAIWPSAVKIPAYIWDIFEFVAFPDPCIRYSTVRSIHTGDFQISFRDAGSGKLPLNFQFLLENYITDHVIGNGTDTWSCISVKLVEGLLRNGEKDGA